MNRKIGSLFVYLCPGAVHEDHGGEEAAHAGQDRLQDLSGDPGSDDGGADHDELEDGDGRDGALEGYLTAAHSGEEKCRIGTSVALCARFNMNESLSTYFEKEPQKRIRLIMMRSELPSVPAGGKHTTRGAAPPAEGSCPRSAP